MSDTPAQGRPVPAENTLFLELKDGRVVIQLRPDIAPHHVARIKELARKGFYDGVVFHRVIEGFMAQGGDPTGTGMGGPGYRFQDETKGSPHKFDKPGKLAMANSGPGTNGCQFFITVAPTLWLTGNHTIFGEVVEGQEIVVNISKVPRSGQDKPHKPVVLESVVIERIA